jgi:hypothetical protein
LPKQPWSEKPVENGAILVGEANPASNSFSTWLGDAGVGYPVIQSLLQHTLPHVTRLYYKVTVEAKWGAIGHLPNLLSNDEKRKRKRTTKARRRGSGPRG